MPRAASTLLVVSLVLLLACQLAHWTWVFVSPAPSRVSLPAAREVDFAAIARLFGAEAPVAAPRAAGTLRLKGVVAPTPGVAASAIFATGGARDVSVYIGGEVQPGVKLAEVHPDHAIVSRAGVRERIDLEERRGIVAQRGPAGPAANAFRVNVSRTGSNSFAFSRKELDDALRDPAQLGYLGQLGQPSSGGVRLDQAPPGSLAAKLGLQPGDVIKKVNGQAVASTGDLARLYAQYAMLTGITAEVQRGSGTVQLSYAIQP